MHGVLEPAERADVAGHERSAVQSDAHADPLAEPVRAQPLVEARQTHVDHVAGGRERAVGVVLDLDRRAERREEAVAPVGDERPAVLEDRVARLVEVAVERIDHELGRAVLGERGEPAEVGEHHRPDGADAAEAEVVVRPRQHVVDDVLGEEPAEDVVDLCPLEVVESLLGQTRR